MLKACPLVKISLIGYERGTCRSLPDQRVDRHINNILITADMLLSIKESVLTKKIMKPAVSATTLATPGIQLDTGGVKEWYRNLLQDTLESCKLWTSADQACKGEERGFGPANIGLGEWDGGGIGGVYVLDWMKGLGGSMVWVAWKASEDDGGEKLMFRNESLGLESLGLRTYGYEVEGLEMRWIMLMSLVLDTELDQGFDGEELLV
ncbi:hypothetical protein Tco_0729706 [Tanacetum coccineum]|uniref:Uncharacterized protein n=1 Tax=Tanacetum coccineum TaxID=301880 RepID=A0ABQ4YS36_9ASTR